MQAVEVRPTPMPSPPGMLARDSALSPAAMARHLRRSGGEAALCFARSIYEDAAWANEEWGAYWAAVIRLV